MKATSDVVAPPHFEKNKPRLIRLRQFLTTNSAFHDLFPLVSPVFSENGLPSAVVGNIGDVFEIKAH
jgi:hypothetical protein